jgi:hypothetical protein
LAGRCFACSIWERAVPETRSIARVCWSRIFRHNHPSMDGPYNPYKPIQACTVFCTSRPRAATLAHTAERQPVCECLAVARYRGGLAQIDRHGGAAALHQARRWMHRGLAESSSDLAPGTEARAANQRSAASPVSQQPAHAATVRSQLAPATTVQSVPRLRRENILL